MMSEDPFLGDAQFTVSVDGVQIGGTLTTTAVNWQGQQQAFLVSGNFGSGAHSVSVNFLNDAGVLNPDGLAYDAQDRNLYIYSITYDDRPVPGTPYELFANGSHSFSVAAGGLANQETIAASTASATIALSGATIIASMGDHMFFLTGSNDTLSATGGKETVQQYSGNANTIQTGAGNDMISLTGTGNVADAGAGQNQIYDSGTANRIVLPAAGNGFDDIFGPVLLNGDTIDMRAMLQAAHWSGDQSVIGNYLHATSANDGQDTMISVTPNGGGSSYSVADLHGVGAVTVAGLLAHSGPSRGSIQDRAANRPRKLTTDAFEIVSELAGSSSALGAECGMIPKSSEALLVRAISWWRRVGALASYSRRRAGWRHRLDSNRREARRLDHLGHALEQLPMEIAAGMF
jgi:hypothetical protein